MIGEFNWEVYWSPIKLSLQVSLISSIIVVFLGLAVAWWMSKRGVFRGKLLLETIILLPVVLPPTVVGFLLLVLLGRKGWVGQLMEAIFQAPIVFTWWAAVIAAIVVAFPLVYQSFKVGLAAVDRELLDAARSNGASEWQVFRYITFPLILPSFISAYVLGFARSLGEFGATLMIAGNIPGKTQTVPTAIYVAVDTGSIEMAWAWTITIIIISCMMLFITGRIQK